MVSHFMINDIQLSSGCASNNNLPFKRFAAFKELKKAFLKDMNVRNSSKDTYETCISNFFKWIEDTHQDLTQLQRADIIAYKENMRERGLSPLTIASYMTVIRLFYEWTETKKLYPNIAKGIRVKKENNGFMKMHLTVEESKRLLMNVKKKNLSSRNFAIVNLILYTGLRTIEVTRANIADIETVRGKHILRVQGKGQDTKKKFVVLIDDVYNPIIDYLKNERKTFLNGEPLFTTDGKGHRGKRMSERQIQIICKENLKEIGLEGHAYSAHSLRHTTGSQILKVGGNIFDVQRVLRHSSPSTSELYTVSIEDDNHIDNPPEEKIKGLFDISNPAQAV